jgi:hypothetical protein
MSRVSLPSWLPKRARRSWRLAECLGLPRVVRAGGC